MSFAYASRKRGEIAAPKAESAAPQPSMEALRSGAAKPTQALLGHEISHVVSQQRGFESVSKYIDDMDEKGMLVDEWNDETAKAQLLSARGSNMIKRTEKQGNTYYQRMLMSILDKKTAQKADYYS